jgi:hypothetical protein
VHEGQPQRSVRRGELFGPGGFPGSGEPDHQEHREREHAEVSMLALHLLQSSLVFINTQLLQAVLRDPAWAGKLTEEDRRGLSPLFWSHVNPYG